MIQALPKKITFAEFVEWKPEGKRYELHNGLIVEMAQPLGDHEDIVGFLVGTIGAEYLRLKLAYRIPKMVLVKHIDSESAYSPDILVLNHSNLINEPLWKKESTVTQGASIPLVIEVVSTNWRVDYLTKVKDYEEIGIPEYWIVDYLALGGTPYIGDPKQPTISIYNLVDGEYKVSRFRGKEKIRSHQFTDLNLTAEQIFHATL